ncbi:MAG: response regulator [Cyclobacteriaceae bacterium]|nr:response regulator [Cyclobacteriaceae bacterium]
MSSATILVVDDEPQIRKLLEISLEANGYKVLQAQSGKEGIMLAASHLPDLIILDLGLPDKNGHEVLRELRNWYNRPVLILSVIDHESDIVTALDEGAADYLTKPFRTAELMARIRSALRHNQSTETNTVINCGDLVIDLAARLVKKNGEIVKTTSTEFNLLALFVRNEGRALTHQYILKEVWGVGYQEETQYLRVFVGSLRKKIEDNPNKPKHLITESGVGYRFV